MSDQRSSEAIDVPRVDAWLAEHLAGADAMTFEFDNIYARLLASSRWFPPRGCARHAS